jgi:hemolysin III
VCFPLICQTVRVDRGAQRRCRLLERKQEGVDLAGELPALVGDHLVGSRLGGVEALADGVVVRRCLAVRHGDVMVREVRVPPVTDAPPLVSRRPHLRGWSHVLATLPWAVGTIVLVNLAAGHPGRQLTLAIYGLASVWLFAISGLYHVVTWSPPRRAVLRRLDHANIFVLVAATYTPVMLTLTSAPWGISVVTAVWVLAGAGVGVSLSPLAMPRWAGAGLYVLLSWISLIAGPVIAAAVGVGGLVLLLAGGLLYTLGALAYAMRRPALAPSWFGYHELFHALVIGANALFFAFMVVEVVHH